MTPLWAWQDESVYKNITTLLFSDLIVVDVRNEFCTSLDITQIIKSLELYFVKPLIWFKSKYRGSSFEFSYYCIFTNLSKISKSLFRMFDVVVMIRIRFVWLKFVQRPMSDTIPFVILTRMVLGYISSIILNIVFQGSPPKQRLILRYRTLLAIWIVFIFNWCIRELVFSYVSSGII